MFSRGIHMKYQALFSLKNNEKVFVNVVCCSRDCWRLRVNNVSSNLTKNLVSK